MHPYRMQQLIRQRHKDNVVNVGQRSQLYKTIDRLVRDGLITVQGTERERDRPERTVYTVTEAGRRAAEDWTVQMLSSPRKEFAEFTAGLAHLPALTPAQALAALETRLADRFAELNRHRADLAGHPDLPRVVLIEVEYAIAHLQSDVHWIAALINDLRSGTFTWSTEELFALAQRFEAQENRP
jgi:DNA-binding PadR family transcriptional regulator